MSPERDEPPRAGPYPSRNPRREETQQNAELQAQQDLLRPSQRTWQASCRNPFPPPTWPSYLLPLYEELNLQLAARLALQDRMSEFTNPLPPLLSPRDAPTIGDELQRQHLPGLFRDNWQPSAYQNPLLPGLNTPSIDICPTARQPWQDVESMHRYAPRNQPPSQPAHEDQFRPVHQQPGLQLDQFRPVNQQPGLQSDQFRPVHQQPGLQSDQFRPVRQQPGLQSDQFRPVRQRPGLQSGQFRSAHPQQAIGLLSDRQQDPPSPIRRSLAWLSLPALEEFIRFDKDHVSAIISRNDLHASAEDIFHHLMAWVEASDDRRTFLPGLLVHVRLIFLPVEFLRDVARKHPLIVADGICTDYVRLAMEYRRLFAFDRRRLRRGQFLTADSGLPVSAVYEQRHCRRRISFEPHKKIYVFGGNTNFTKHQAFPTTTLTFEYFDCEHGSWHHGGNMPTSRVSFSAAAFQGNIWIVGGRGDGKGELDDEIGVVRTTHIYNPVRDEWSVGPSLIKKRIGFGLIEYRGSLYAIGGSSRRLRDQEKSVEVVKVSENLTWEEGVEMNLPRSGMGVAVLLSRIYVIGGVRLEDNNQIEYFHSVTNQWTLVPNIYIARRDYSDMVVDDEIVYSFGDVCRTRIAYNPAADSRWGWKRLEINARCLKYNTALAAADGYIYFIGGFSNDERTDSISGYRPANQRWDVDCMRCTSPRAFAKAVVVNKCF